MTGGHFCCLWHASLQKRHGPGHYRIQLAAPSLASVSPTPLLLCIDGNINLLAHERQFEFLRSWHWDPDSPRYVIYVMSMCLYVTHYCFYHCPKRGQLDFHSLVWETLFFPPRKGSLCRGISGVGQEYQGLERRDSLGENLVRVCALSLPLKLAIAPVVSALTEVRLSSCYEDCLWLLCSC